MADSEEPFRRGMVIMAHPDDAEWSCSGTVAKWCAEGWEVVYILCTDGSKGSSDPEMTSEKLVKIREQEQRNAGKILGLKDIVFLGYPDAYLEPTLELRKDIAREIRRYKPDVVICGTASRQLHSNYLGHPDHFASGEAAMAAVFPTARDRLTFPELLDEGLDPHNVREVWVAGGGDGSDQFVDVAEYMDTAVKALKAHVSQVDQENAGEWFRQGRIRTGEKVGMAYAEGFKRIRLG
ncbi:MAG TPA: PIG-L family deacetylase [Dehalococcoidia bacterium]|nr:GlcNAc-PI de-N-acetylase [Chloroflexota bacterium]MQF95052.1 PIG-L family deacetylase [SAR202 cluster bacterium]HAA95064.1 PIG-L family deacetylase [Dehalococcoidia bacterium]HCL26542.1 PIG-L family deacetylase [Dehalococcoidia bacterium]|tara:strand:- start:4411 stop:5121 length:711 start_codon:yes stop_codon:yes gene_type:complete